MAPFPQEPPLVARPGAVHLPHDAQKTAMSVMAGHSASARSGIRATGGF
jgi:hypothetical protein